MLLTARGHKLESIAPLLLQAAAALDSETANIQAKPVSNTLYFHLPFHPYGIQKQTVRHLYNEILQPHVPYDNMQVAISWPKNLRDLFTKARLDIPNGICLQDLIRKLTTTTTDPTSPL
jgi:hypothetical protein